MNKHPAMTSDYLSMLMILALALLVAAGHSECHPFVESQIPGHLGRNEEKLTHLHFYDLLVGPNKTSVKVAPANPGSPLAFGIVTVTDEILTNGPDIYSNVIGRGQGTYAFASMGELVLAATVNYVFLVGEYNGSYISVVGRDPADEKKRELAIVGGGGLFRLARGYVELTTYSIDLETGNSIIDGNFYVYQY
ncbi:hypothetical protein MLD38_019128 [Melastoma candidum]|uniref:Uncharacterized protein n=1 Tax=Melastoma candidum TaxID=119954 RepID=A0ACB9QZ31_9MYRT|nr:hypothetical protein MLD38_019128 [Melastoma candidum]